MSDDAVGYGRPPKHTRFRKGQSGNPKGRPRRSRNLRSDLQEELQATVTVREGGREMKVTKQRAVVMGLLAKAMKGDAKATERLVDLIERLLVQQEEWHEPSPMSAEEREVLSTLSQRLLPSAEEGRSKPDAKS